MARYDATTKTATLTFAPNHKLEKDHYYYLTITNVVPNEAAFQEYQTGNSYNAVGDTPSDASDDGYQAVSTGTSSGKKGFKSNASASISYTYKDVNHTELIMTGCSSKKSRSKRNGLAWMPAILKNR